MIFQIGESVLQKIIQIGKNQKKISTEINFDYFSNGAFKNLKSYQNLSNI